MVLTPDASTPVRVNHGETDVQDIEPVGAPAAHDHSIRLWTLRRSRDVSRSEYQFVGMGSRLRSLK